MTQARRLKIRKLLKNPLALSLYAIKLLRMMGPRDFIRDMRRKTAFLLTREAQPRR
ncbi:hypothetical protein [Inquilinus sp. Marseille-Q2685]|uniref:hypothetical protein n=1 Tax=Inquilinus sp. Marseille-Q2685 TaxID=2866581 RepID=UPI001CE47DD9|nr:hypothetical protein [Inquilinus sp. Marseille-Q2685]